jgi:quinolinate synthase
MDYKKEIRRLAEEKDAVILAHNYQIDDIQEIADITGDSLGLSIEAAKTDKSVIVFCGVHFMAETAYMLSPDKTVLLPEAAAGCPMADMITGEKLREFKQKHPGAATVCYVNTSAEVKAESDICCTSANAVNVIKHIDNDKIIFVPDRNLGHYVSRFTDKEMILWQGWCPIHQRTTELEVRQLKGKYPDAPVVVHPENPPEVVDLADHVCSTSGVYTYCRESDAKRFIIATEEGVGYRLRLENPDKEFIFAYKGFVCKNMKKTSLKSVYEALLHKQNIVTVPEEIRLKGVKCIERMLEVPRNY